MRKNSLKNTRINGEVQRVLAEIIRNDIKDPRIHPMTSVVTVTVAPDLKTCKAFISVLGDDRAAENTLAGLKSAGGYIRKELARLYSPGTCPAGEPAQYSGDHFCDGSVHCLWRQYVQKDRRGDGVHAGAE